MKDFAKVKNLYIGKDYPISVQTMWDRPISKDELPSILKRIDLLKKMGADLIRFSYSALTDKDTFKNLCTHSSLPIVADIHFDYKMAMEAIESGASKIRINPGNIGDKWKTEEIVKKALDNQVAIRIGLNSGSLPKDSKTDDKALIMVNSAEEYLSWFDSWNFDNTVVSLKSTSVEDTIRANEIFRNKFTIPLHLGITEAGGIVTSSVRSTIAFYKLLSKGIGETLRYSITGPIEKEVQAGVELLRTLGLRKDSIKIIACPRCERNSFDTHSFLEEVEERLLSINKNISVAIMGCTVNGPGEAKSADIAISGINDEISLYKKGKLINKINKEDAVSAFFELVENYE